MGGSALLFSQIGTRGPATGDSLESGKLPGGGFGEEISPRPNYPWRDEAGLSDRATPYTEWDNEEIDEEYNQLFRLIKPYYDNIFADRKPMYQAPPDPSTFRPVTVAEPPLGLYPVKRKPGLVELYLWVGLAQSYDSNVQMTATNQIADFFISPRAGLAWTAGTAETITELNFAYECYEDFFYENPNLNAFNQKLDFSTRIGRDAAIWRPFVTVSDITGSNLLLDEQTNRTRRVRVLPGIDGDYRLTTNLGFHQTFSYFSYQHPDGNGFINLKSYDTRQELLYRAFHDLRFLVYGQYRYSDPSQGVGASEAMVGLGWRGRPDPRIYTEMRVGYDFFMPNSPVPGWKDLSGFRFNGYTTFDMSPRFRPTLKYDRDYVFTEFGVNDNYVATLVQVRLETFLGTNWYLTPYVAMCFFDYEFNSRYAFQIRPEVELAYAFASDSKTSQPRAFAKFGYQSYDITEGGGSAISGFRAAVGFEWKF